MNDLTDPQMLCRRMSVTCGAAIVALTAMSIGLLMSPVGLRAQPVKRPADCTEVMAVGNVFFGHDCGEFATVLISGRIVLRKPWSRANRAARAVRIRERRERSGETSAEPAPNTPAAPASGSVMLYGIDVSGGSNLTGLDCDDFASQQEAQAFFDAQGWSASNDPEQLDQGGEPGVPCED